MIITKWSLVGAVFFLFGSILNEGPRSLFFYEVYKETQKN